MSHTDRFAASHIYTEQLRALQTATEEAVEAHEHWMRAVRRTERFEGSDCDATTLDMVQRAETAAREAWILAEKDMKEAAKFFA